GERAPRQPQITGSERDRPRGGDSTQRPSPRKDSGKPGSRAPRPARQQPWHAGRRASERHEQASDQAGPEACR
ncbi:pseudouridine synthase, Rsu, partial [Pseudomonas syringae pv. pisi str. 1704B]